MTQRTKTKEENQQDLAVKLVEVSKRYTIHHEKPTLIEHLINSKHEEFWALKNINLEIEKGEKVGIIGPNGCGKTTLLKIITGITTPTEGKIVTKGRIVSLIDLEAGFHPELTGLQNIYLSGILLGLSRKSIEEKLKSIVKFADIKQFMDVPLFTYSEGMKLRLGFSVAVYANADILILDEGMAAGDQEFQRKSIKKMKELFSRGKTIIVVSHWLDFIKKNCQKVVMLDKGKILDVGGIEVISLYKNKFS